jgi:hypothetical protein
MAWTPWGRGEEVVCGGTWIRGAERIGEGLEMRFGEEFAVEIGEERGIIAFC